MKGNTKSIIARLKLLESKSPNTDSINKQRYEDAVKEVMKQATTEELRIAVRSNKYSKISESESLDMIKTLSERVDGLLIAKVGI